MHLPGYVEDRTDVGQDLGQNFRVLMEKVQLQQIIRKLTYKEMSSFHHCTTCGINLYWKTTECIYLHH